MMCHNPIPKLESHSHLVTAQGLHVPRLLFAILGNRKLYGTIIKMPFFPKTLDLPQLALISDSQDREEDTTNSMPMLPKQSVFESPLYRWLDASSHMFTAYRDTRLESACTQAKQTTP